MNLRHELLCSAVAALCLVVTGCAGRSASGADATSQPARLADATPAADDAGGQPNDGIAIRPATPQRRVADDAGTAAPDATRAIPCATRDVVLAPGADNGDFNGMSHSGTYLTLTNKSRNACSVPGLPQLTFVDANGPVKTEADLPGAKFMHPGPVVLPIVLQPKQSVRTSARWVSGPVFQDNQCYKITGVSLALRNGAVVTPLIVQMCGERSKGVHYDLARYGTAAAQ